MPRPSWKLPRPLALIVLFAAVVALGHLACRSAPVDPLEDLFGRLPRDQAVYLYVDIARMRSLPRLEPLWRTEPGSPNRFGRLFEQASFLLTSDLQEAALAAGEKQMHVLLRGRFHGDAIRRYANERGGECEKPLDALACTFSVGEMARPVTLTLLSPSLLSVIDRPLPAANASPQSFDGPKHLAARVHERRGHGAFLWLAVHTAGLDVLQPAFAESPVNLAFFARVLAGTDWNYLSLEEAGSDASLLLRLEAVCKSPQEAEDLERSLRGLNLLAASIAGAASGPDDPGAWAGMLRSARFEVQGASVVAVWSVDPALIFAAAG